VIESLVDPAPGCRARGAGWRATARENADVN